MSNEDAVVVELQKLREGQAQALAIARESLQLQKQALELQQNAVKNQVQAVDAQFKHARLYKVVVAVTAVVLGYVLYRLVTALP